MHIEMLLHLLHMVEASRQALPHLDVGLMETSTGADVANVPPVGLSQPMVRKPQGHAWISVVMQSRIDVEQMWQAEASWDPRADLAPHVATTANAVDYEAALACVCNSLSVYT